MTIATLGYFLGWVVGMLGALIVLSVAKDLVIAGVTIYTTTKLIKWYQERSQEKLEVVDTEAKFVS